ncbi:MAG: cytochrome b5 [Deltaproteobacteria bacterium]|nr:cytochrome b5 [Deltaproteobacteria bacterium]
MKEFTREELARFDGKQGRPVYVAQGGRVFDVSGSKLWRNGSHMRRHEAGNDLTTDLQAAPHGIDRLERFPQVGTLVEAPTPSTEEETGLERLLNRFPRLRRHPHPMTVHFPLAFAVVSPLFALLHRTTGVASFATTAHHCLWGLFLSTPVAIGTGYLTWKINYLGKPLRPVRIKERLALVLWGLALGLLVWKARDPLAPAGALYLALLCLLVPLAVGLGWFGSQLTFPVEKG